MKNIRTFSDTNMSKLDGLLTYLKRMNLEYTAHWIGSRTSEKELAKLQIVWYTY